MILPEEAEATKKMNTETQRPPRHTEKSDRAALRAAGWRTKAGDAGQFTLPLACISRFRSPPLRPAAGRPAVAAAFKTPRTEHLDLIREIREIRAIRALRAIRG